MSFPASIKEIQDIIITREKAAITAGDEASRLESERFLNKEVAKTLNGLLNSWREVDPGKYRDAYFFLDSALRQRVVVREFLPEDVKVYKTQQEWNEYTMTRSLQADYDGVPYHYPIVSLDVVGRSECLSCKSTQPVVEHYKQTRGSPSGDEWLKRRLILCLDCNSIKVLNFEYSDGRF